MTIALIIYLSGVIFFLSQALIYSRLSGARVRGAIAWPLLVFALPELWVHYRMRIEHEENKLAHNERLGLKAMTLGHEGGRFMWGVGA